MKRYLRSIRFLAGAAALVVAGAAHASAQQAAPAVSAPDAADVESIDGIVDALYDVLSGPKGEARDWDRLRSLFHPEARMIPTGPTPTGSFVARLMTVEDYIGSSGAMIEQIGFREVELARRVEAFGNVAHVWSTYAGYREGVEQPFLRGINGIQLFDDGSRWWVMNILWAPERPDLPLPQRYLEDGPAAGEEAR